MKLLRHAIISLFLFTSVASAEEPTDADKILSYKCAVCHGEFGEGNNQLKSPKISGMATEDFIKSVNAGYWTYVHWNINTVNNLSEQEIARLANYYSSLQQ